MIAHRCSLCPVERSGSPGLSRILPGLASDPVTRSERTFEVFRSTSPTCLHCCKPTVDPPFGSTSELPSAARTGSRRSPLLGLDEAGRVAPSASARRPSVDRPFGRLFRGHRARPLPEQDFRPVPSASGCHSRSPVPSSWFRTTSTAFSARRLAGLLHPAADPGVRLVSCPAETAHSPRRYLPSKNVTHPPSALRSPGALAPLMFPLLRGCHLRGCFRRISLGQRRPLLDADALVLPGLLFPLRGSREIVFPLVPSLPRAGRGDEPTVVGREASFLTRLARYPNPRCKSVNRPATSMRFWTSKNVPKSILFGRARSTGAPLVEARGDCSLRASVVCIVLLSSPSESRETTGCLGSRRATPVEFT